MSASGMVRRALLQPALGLSPSALPPPNGHTHFKRKTIYFLLEELSCHKRCPEQRCSKAFASRFLQHLENLNSFKQATMSQLCPSLPSHLPVESILSDLQDQHSLCLSLIQTCSKCAMSYQHRASTPDPSPPGAHKVYLILPCRPMFPPPSATSHKSYTFLHLSHSFSLFLQLENEGNMGN